MLREWLRPDTPRNPGVHERTAMPEELQVRIHGDGSTGTLVYLPGLHGDWTLVAGFRAALAGRVRFAEFTYPRTLDWSLTDYATAILEVLDRNGIEEGWLLAESFGSQVAWALLDAQQTRFRVLGVVLAGGFVRHPFPSLVRLCRTVVERIPMSWVRRSLVLYARYARFRHRHAPETLADIGEFVARRTDLDRRAAAHRLRLIAEADWRPAAARTRLPVYSLTGLFDPIVPWPAVLRWLRHNCPGNRRSRVFACSDHTVLSMVPAAAAEQVLSWIRSEVRTSPGPGDLRSR